MSTIRDKLGHWPSVPIRQGSEDEFAILQMRGERDDSCLASARGTLRTFVGSSPSQRLASFPDAAQKSFPPGRHSIPTIPVPSARRRVGLDRAVDRPINDVDIADAAAGADVRVDQAPLPRDTAEDGQVVEVQADAQV